MRKTTAKYCKKTTVICEKARKETPTQVLSYKICEIFKNTFFYRTPLVGASVYTFLIYPYLSTIYL